MRRLILLAVLATVVLPTAAQAAAPPVVISELRLRGPAGGNDEFVELRNAGAAPVAVGGWTLQGCTATGAPSTRATIPAGTTLPAARRISSPTRPRAARTPARCRATPATPRA